MVENFLESNSHWYYFHCPQEGKRASLQFFKPRMQTPDQVLDMKFCLQPPVKMEFHHIADDDTESACTKFPEGRVPAGVTHHLAQAIGTVRFNTCFWGLSERKANMCGLRKNPRLLASIISQYFLIQENLRGSEGYCLMTTPRTGYTQDLSGLGSNAFIKVELHPFPAQMFLCVCVCVCVCVYAQSVLQAVYNWPGVDRTGRAEEEQLLRAWVSLASAAEPAAA